MLKLKELPSFAIKYICLYINVEESIIFLHLLRNINYLNDPSLLLKMNDVYGTKRLKIWKMLLNIDENTSKYESNYKKKKYQDYINNDKLTLSSSGPNGEIMRDVVRTFPCHPFFKTGQKGQTMLARILLATSLANDDVGYCQGMNFVCGNILLCRLGSYHYIYDINYSDDEYDSSKTNENIKIISLTSQEMYEIESDVFDIMILLSSKDTKLSMFGLWRSDTPKMKLRVYQMDKVLKWILPKIHEHFESIQLAPEILVSQWFITIFSYTLPTTLTFSIWNHIFLGGWSAMFRILLALLQSLEDDFLATDLECIGRLMRQWKKKGNKLSCLSYEELICKANDMSITDAMLKEFEESYALEMFSMSNAYATKIKDSNDDNNDNNIQEKSSWLMRYGETIDESTFNDMIKIQNELSSIDEQIENDKSCIQLKIVKACENHREMQQKYNIAITNQSKCVDLMTNLEIKFKAALVEAQNLAEEAASDLDLSNSNKQSKSESSVKDNKSSFEPFQSAISSLQNAFLESNLFGIIKKRTSSQGNIDSINNNNSSNNNNNSNDTNNSASATPKPVTPIHTPKSKSDDSLKEKDINDIYDDDEDFVIVVRSDPMSDHINQTKSEEIDVTPSRRRINTKMNTGKFNPAPKDITDIDSKPQSLLGFTRSSSNSTLLQNLSKSESNDSDKNDILCKTSDSKDSNDSIEICFQKPPMLKIPEHTTSTTTTNTNTTITTTTTPTTPTPTTPTTKMNMISSALRSALTTLSISPYNNSKLKLFSERSQKCQQKIINLHRSLENAKNDVLLSNAYLRNAHLQLEESLEVKNSLCLQLQSFALDTNQERKHKLQNIANNIRI